MGYLPYQQYCPSQLVHELSSFVWEDVHDRFLVGIMSLGAEETPKKSQIDHKNSKLLTCNSYRRFLTLNLFSKYRI